MAEEILRGHFENKKSITIGIKDGQVFFALDEEAGDPPLEEMPETVAAASDDDSDAS